MMYSQIGVSRPRIDARKQVTGQIQYVADMYLPGMLYAKALLSPEHHARILNLDTSKAERLPGVRAIATARDVPDNFPSMGEGILDQPVFADKKVRHRGEPIVLVAADTEEIASEAVDLVKVDFEPLPVIFDAREAMQPSAPLIHEEGQGKFCKGNIVIAFGVECMRLVHGDVQKGFAEADFILQENFATSAQRGTPIEPHAYLVKPDSNGKVTVWTNSQSPFRVSVRLALVLRLPLNKIRVISPAVGGGFGQKGGASYEANVAALALKIGRPVRWALTMHEHFEVGSTKAPHNMMFKLGVKNDGRLTAIHRTHIANAGAYASVTVRSCQKCTMLGSGPYRIPHQLAETWVVYTNKVASGPFRGYGMSQPAIAFETMMDIAAERLRMDPMEFRLRNSLRDDDICATGQVMHSVGMQACLTKVRDLSQWHWPEHEQNSSAK